MSFKRLKKIHQVKQKILKKKKKMILKFFADNGYFLKMFQVTLYCGNKLHLKNSVEVHSQ